MGDAATGQTSVAASPSVKWTFIGTYNITAAYQDQRPGAYRNGMKASGDPTQIYANSHIPALAYTISRCPTQWRPPGQLETYFNVQNLFNKFPSVPVGGPPNSTPVPDTLPLPIGDDRSAVLHPGFRLRL